MGLCSGELEASTELLVRCHMCLCPESLVLLRIMGWDVARRYSRAGAQSRHDPAAATGAWRELSTVEKGRIT